MDLFKVNQKEFEMCRRRRGRRVEGDKRNTDTFQLTDSVLMDFEMSEASGELEDNTNLSIC